MTKRKLTTVENVLQLLLIVVILPFLVYWTVQKSKSNYGLAYTIQLDSLENKESSPVVSKSQLDTTVSLVNSSSNIGELKAQVAEKLPAPVLSTLKTVLDSVSVDSTLIPSTKSFRTLQVDSNHQFLDTNNQSREKILSDTTTSITPVIQPRIRRKFLFFKFNNSK